MGFKLTDGILFFNNTYIGKCYREVDGYYIYEPATIGQFNEYSLRLIADFLEQLNKPWDKQVCKDLAKYKDDLGENCEEW